MFLKQLWGIGARATAQVTQALKPQHEAPKSVYTGVRTVLRSVNEPSKPQEAPPPLHSIPRKPVNPGWATAPQILSEKVPEKRPPPHGQREISRQDHKIIRNNKPVANAYPRPKNNDPITKTPSQGTGPPPKGLALKIITPPSPSEILRELHTDGLRIFGVSDMQAVPPFAVKRKPLPATDVPGLFKFSGEDGDEKDVENGPFYGIFPEAKDAEPLCEGYAVYRPEILGHPNQEPEPPKKVVSGREVVTVTEPQGQIAVQDCLCSYNMPCDCKKSLGAQGSKETRT